MQGVQKLLVQINAQDNASSKMQKIARNAALAASAFASAFAVKSLKAAIDFESQMQNVATIVDTSKESMEEMGDAVKNVARNTSVPLEELTGSLYDIRSAGISAEGAMNVLSTAANLSVAGLSNAGEATNILTSAINSFGYEGEEAEKVAGILFTTVKQGKTTIAEMAQSFGMVAPIASTAGISLEELSAATAALTTTGQKASMAQTQLKAAILAIQAPTDAMKTIFNKAGIESGQLALKNEGLVSVMNRVVEAANGDADALKKAMGSSEALSATLALTGEQGESFTNTMGEMENGSDSLNTAVEEQNKSFSKQWSMLKNKLDVAMGDMGLLTLPLVKDAVSALSKTMDQLTEDFKNNELSIKKTDTALTVFVKGSTVVLGILYKSIWGIGYALAWAIDHIQQFGVAFGEAFANKAASAVNALIDPLNISIGLVNKLIGAINKIPSVNIPSIPSIPKLNSRANGGLITEPVVGVGLKTGESWSFGEKGTEMVIPNSSLKNGGGQSVVINISGNSFLGNARNIAKELGKELMSEINLNVNHA